jgi:hypothetical protein
VGVTVRQKVEESITSGQSFSMRDFVTQQVGEEEAGQIDLVFASLCEDKDMLMPGAHELLRYIESDRRAKAGILTYGSYEGQTRKIHAAGLSRFPSLVTQEARKGLLIDSWYQGEGQGFILPKELGGVAAREVVFTDDKLVSFESFPPTDAVGYWVPNVYRAVPGSLAHNITPVDDLHDMLEREVHRRSVNKA